MQGATGIEDWALLFDRLCPLFSLALNTPIIPAPSYATFQFSPDLSARESQRHPYCAQRIGPSQPAQAA